MSRKAKRRPASKAELAHRLRIAQARKAAAKYRLGDPVRARRFINTGKQGEPEIVAHPGDEGVIVGLRPPGHRDYGLLAVRFGDVTVDLMPEEIEPDWEDDDG